MLLVHVPDRLCIQCAFPTYSLHRPECAGGTQEVPAHSSVPDTTSERVPDHVLPRPPGCNRSETFPDKPTNDTGKRSPQIWTLLRSRTSEDLETF